MTDRLAEARAEAERAASDAGITYRSRFVSAAFRDGVEQGVVWADANTQPRKVTRAQFEQAYESLFFPDVSHAKKVLTFLRELGIEVGDE